MDAFREWWDKFSSNKVVLTVIACVLLLAIVLIVLSKTSFGKKFYKKVNDKFNGLAKRQDKVEYDVSNYQKDINKTVNDAKTDFNDLVVDTNKKIAILFLQYESFKKDIYTLIEKVPNAKVKKGLDDLKNKTKEGETQIKAIVGDNYDKVKDLLDSLNKKAHEPQNEPIVEELSDGE